jgi:hypothetical protein
VKLVTTEAALTNTALVLYLIPSSPRFNYPALGAKDLTYRFKERSTENLTSRNSDSF